MHIQVHSHTHALPVPNACVHILAYVDMRIFCILHSDIFTYLYTYIHTLGSSIILPEVLPCVLQTQGPIHNSFATRFCQRGRARGRFPTRSQLDLANSGAQGTCQGPPAAQYGMLCRIPPLNTAEYAIFREAEGQINRKDD